MGAFLKNQHDKHPEQKPMKSIVSWQAYYPDICMIQTEEGYTRMYRMDDVHGEDRDSYEREVHRYVKFRKDLHIQVSHIGEKDYILYTVQSATPEEAHAKLLAADITFDPAPMEKWLSAITEMTQSGPFTDTDRIGAVNKKGRPKGKLLPHLQPFYPPPRYDPKGKVLKNRDGRVFEADDRFLRTVVLTGYPESIYPSLFTELIRSSDTVFTAIHLQEIDREKCRYALDHFQGCIRKTMSEDREGRIRMVFDV